MRTCLLVVLTFAGACAAPRSVPPAPPQPAAAPTSRAAASAVAPAPAASASAYSGHGAESVSPETLARFAPTPLPSDVSRRIQAILDVRAPIGAAIAPGGKSLYFAWNVTGVFQLWKVDGPRQFPVQLTGGEDVTRVAAITPDGKWLVVSRDRKGEENPGLYLLPAEGGALRVIQHKPKVQTVFERLSDDGRHVYFRANDLKPDSYAIYRYEVASGARETVLSQDGLWHIEDAKPNRLLLAKATGAMTRELWEWEETAKKLAPLFGQGETEEYQVKYAAAEGELLVRTAKFGDFRRLYRARPPAGKSAWEGGPLAQGCVTAITPELPHDVAGFSQDRPRRVITYTLNEGGYTRARALDARTFADKKLPELKDEDHVTFGASSWDGRFVVVNASGSRHATVSYVLDWQSGKLTQWVVPSTPEIDTTRFAVPTLETYAARDGTKIPMFVRRPAACASVAPGNAPCPVVVHFHGGPEGQALPGLSVWAQSFVEAGFVWVEPNVRGSDGYGKQWLHADDGRKRLQVITDIEDAALHVRRAFAVGGKEPKVGVFGGSYGGYSTLVAMTRFAGAYDAGVAVVGISNLMSFLLNTAPYRRALRISEYGDPEKDRDALIELSPVTHIDKVKAPLLLIQGATDPRVPVGEALQMHAALERRGNPTKMIIFPDEGHGAQKRENKVLEIGHTLAFFEKHLK